MATKSELDALANRLSESLQLDCEPMNMEQMIYTANPVQLKYLREQVLTEQYLCPFDDEGRIKKFVAATKPKAKDDAGDSSVNNICFQNQIMMATAVDCFDQMPADLKNDWMCIVCPEGTRVLVVACYKSTRVYDLEGTWICEHDTHLPGGSPNNISKVDDDSKCTVLDCLYNDEQEVYYVLDVLCWKGQSYYKYETSFRITAVLEEVKELPTLKQVTQTNPFRFYSLPVSYVCHKSAICSTIGRASFSITGLLFYHKKALYLPGLTPLGVWLETYYIPCVMDIQVHKLEYCGAGSLPGRRYWKKNRYEMKPQQCSTVHNSAYATHYQRNWIPCMAGVPHYGGGNRGYNMSYQQPYYPHQYKQQAKPKKGKDLKNSGDKTETKAATTTATQSTAEDSTEKTKHTAESQKDANSETEDTAESMRDASSEAQNSSNTVETGKTEDTAESQNDANSETEDTAKSMRDASSEAENSSASETEDTAKSSRDASSEAENSSDQAETETLRSADDIAESDTVTSSDKMVKTEMDRSAEDSGISDATELV